MTVLPTPVIIIVSYLIIFFDVAHVFDSSFFPVWLDKPNTNHLSHLNVVRSSKSWQVSLKFFCADVKWLETFLEPCGFRPPQKSTGQGHVSRCLVIHPVSKHPHRPRPYPLCVPPECSPHIAFRPIHPSTNDVKRGKFRQLEKGDIPDIVVWNDIGNSL
jgi:hypothetical protein